MVPEGRPWISGKLQRSSFGLPVRNNYENYSTREWAALQVHELPIGAGSSRDWKGYLLVFAVESWLCMLEVG